MQKIFHKAYIRICKKTFIKPLSGYAKNLSYSLYPDMQKIFHKTYMRICKKSFAKPISGYAKKRTHITSRAVLPHKK